MAKTQRTIFYSWQSDRKPNRNLIGEALEAAAAALRNDGTLSVDPVIDRDTAGLPGAPSISEAIFGKIDAAAAFVGDVTFIDNGSGRRCPNPNVLIELGYAVKALGWARVIPVMNTKIGTVEELPFDLRHRRATPFSAEPEQDNSAERHALTRTLTEALRQILAAIPEPEDVTAIARALAAIKEARPDRRAAVRAFADDVFAVLNAVSPNLSGQEWRDEEFLSALEQARPIVAHFAEVARQAAQHHDGIAARELFHAIEQAAQGLVVNRTGTSWEHEHDYWQFVVLELHLVLIGALLAEDRLELAGELLREPCVVVEHGQSITLSLGARCGHIQRLKRWDATNSLSPLGLFLQKRYSDPEEPMPLTFPEISDADLFILVAAGVESGADGKDQTKWTAWTLPHASRLPRFMARLSSRKYSEQLAGALGIANDAIKPRFESTLRTAPRSFGHFGRGFPRTPVSAWDWNQIASTP